MYVVHSVFVVDLIATQTAIPAGTGTTRQVIPVGTGAELPEAAAPAEAAPAGSSPTPKGAAALGIANQ